MWTSSARPKDLRRADELDRIPHVRHGTGQTSSCVNNWPGHPSTTKRSVGVKPASV
jgi:hypothetical protein